MATTQPTAALLKTRDVYAAAQMAMAAIREARKRDIRQRLQLRVLLRWVATGEGPAPSDSILELEYNRLQVVRTLAIASLNVVPDGTMYVSDADWMLLERTYAD